MCSTDISRRRAFSCPTIALSRTTCLLDGLRDGAHLKVVGSQAGRRVALPPHKWPRSNGISQRDGCSIAPLVISCCTFAPFEALELGRQDGKGGGGRRMTRRIECGAKVAVLMDGAPAVGERNEDMEIQSLI
eukprot:scaffold304_cov248-Pinguiococcus_pyrenoidosus.AAC.17